MIPTDSLDQLRTTFARMEQQGLSAEFSEQAQECAMQLLAIIDRYKAPGLAALGAAVAIIDSATLGTIDGHRGMAGIVNFIRTTNGEHPASNTPDPGR